MRQYNYKDEFQKWIDSPSISEEEWNELNSLDDSEIKERFFSPLEFGTAGLRGTMKTGLHNMNIHVIRHATQSFADVIVSEGPDAMKKGIIIAHDCRLNGRAFAEEAACVMAANGIHVKLFESLRPTPELSFAVLHFHATAGLNITASHNPKEYNGYKVYWSDGAQLPPDKASAIAERMEINDVFTSIKNINYNEAINNGDIEIIGSDVDELFMDNVLSMAINQKVVEEVADNFKIVYTPFHGCGYKLVPEVLKRLGIKHLYPVKEQMEINGEFPTVVSPNPENPEGFYLAVDLAKEVGSDLIIGTDPDSDRVGVMVKASDNEYKVITGNQMGALLLDYIITAKKLTNTLKENDGTVCSIVSTLMARAIAEKNGVHFEDTFTGFKFMAERISEWEAAHTYNYIFAFEESYGYMMGDYVRDKDAVTASMMIAEMAAYYYKNGMTLLEALESLYQKYGYFKEKTVNLIMPGLDGLEKMNNLMCSLRDNHFDMIAGTKVMRIRDYLDGSIYVTGIGRVDSISMSGSNVIYYELEKDTSIIIRPSGTEPKIKVYILTRGNSISECDAIIDKYTEFINSLAE